MIKLIDLVKVLPATILFEDDSTVIIRDYETTARFYEDSNGDMLLGGDKANVSRRDILYKEVTRVDPLNHGCIDVYVR